MDMWMRNNFSHKFELCVQKVTRNDINIKSYAHWIITLSGNGQLKLRMIENWIFLRGLYEKDNR